MFVCLCVRVCVRMRPCFMCAFLFNCQKQFTNFITKLCASRINLSIRHHSTRPPEKLLKVQHCFFVYICACSLPGEDSTAYPRLCLVAFNIVGSFLLFTLKDIQLLKAHSFPPAPTPPPLPSLNSRRVCQRKYTRNYMYHTNFFIPNISSHYTGQ